VGPQQIFLSSYLEDMASNTSSPEMLKQQSTSICVPGALNDLDFIE